MLDRHGKVILADSVFVDHEVFAANIWNEIPVWILNEQLECHRSGSRIIVNFGFLGALRAFKERLRPVGNAHLARDRRCRYEYDRSSDQQPHETTPRVMLHLRRQTPRTATDLR